MLKNPGFWAGFRVQLDIQRNLMIRAKNSYGRATTCFVVKNHISIALIVSGMVLIDSWYQEVYILSICTDILALAPFLF